MYRKLTNFIVGAFALVLSAPYANAQTQLFTSASNNKPGYRIPSIVRYPSDKTGVLKGGLWAFADLRYQGGDIGNNNPIDITSKKLVDGTTAWTEPILITHRNNSSQGYDFAFGDAATVVDRESGKILLMTAAGRNSVWVKTAGYPNVARHIYDPETGKWTTTEATTVFYGPNNTYASHLFVSSGRMIQSTIYKKDKYFRIYAAICTVSGNGSRVAYSDDFGETWSYLGGPTASPIPDGDECKVEELPDGSILLNAKRYNKKESGKTYYGRCINIFTFTDVAKGEGSWDKVVTSGTENVNDQTFTANCNAEIMLVPARKQSDGSQTYLLLLAGPNSTGRNNGCIFWKELPSTAAEYRKPSNYVSGWSKYVYSPNTYCAYITMTLDKDGNIALLDENGGISYRNYPLSTITGGAYTYHVSAKGTYHTSSEPTFVKQPSLGLNGGIYTTNQTVTINKPEGITVYYTLDGSDPVVSTTTTASEAKGMRRAPSASTTKVYTDPIQLTTGATTLKAVAVDDYSGNVSQTVTASYLITSVENTSTTSASKQGTTISLDHDNATNLFTNNGSGKFWAYLRHNSTHIQLISSSDAALASGQQVFAVTNNNMVWNSDNNYLELYNGLLNGKDRIQYGYYCILAPKGYRFLRYEIDMDKASENGAKLDEYKYKSGSNTEINVVYSATASNSQDVKMERTLSDGTNVLYFRMDGQTVNDQNPIVVQSIKLTYAIDDSFTAQVPNENGTKIHSGFIDLGTFSKGDNNKYNYGFSNGQATDLETVKVVKSDGSAPQNVTVDGGNYFMATTDGDYYVEAPAKFRIVGATVNTKRGSGSISTDNWVSYTPSESASNEAIFIRSKDGGHYLSIQNGVGQDVTDISQATKFTITHSAQGYAIMTSGQYVYMNADGKSVHTSTSAQYWTLTSNGQLQFNIQNKGVKFLVYSAQNAQWGFGSSNTDYPTLLHNEPITTTYSAGNFTAKVYNRENTNVADNGELSVTETSTPSVTVSDMNNDAIHINLSGISSGSAALFNVSLQLLPLDPEVSSVEAAAKIDNDVVGNSPVTSYNYVFNNGATIGVPVPSTTAQNKAITMVFRKAQNEEQTLWYSTGTNQNNPNVKGGYSNVYLIGSTADATNGLDITSPYPDARTAVDQLGSNAISATNIKQLADAKNTSVNTLKDNTVDATSAGLKDVTMTLATPSYNGGNKFYIYSVDQPTYQIMPSSIATKHVDFRFFTISVKPVVAEKPKIEIVPIYTTTMKGAPHKKSSTLKSDADTPDATHTYVGIKVSAEATGQNTQLYGALTAEDIYTAMTTALKEKYGFENDPLRGVLYVDMSGLTTVTTSSNTTMAKYASETADNCLYFMPQGFAGAGLGNVISKQSDGSYQSFGDVTVYDQQPFYTPYDFNTGSYKAVYQREGTVKESNTKALVRNMAAVLPFDVHLDEQGHPYLDGLDHAAQHITFRNITGSGDLTGVRKDSNGQPLTYAVVASYVDSKLASANTPYYVTVDKDHDAGFTFNVPGANFASSAKVAGATIKDEKMLSTNGTWTGHGTYCGGTVNTDPGLWYFSKDLFWKSSLLKNYSVVNVRPFRAYYITTDKTPAAKAAVVYDNSEIVTTGITNVKGETTHTGKVYTIDGRYVGTSLEGLAPGLYIQDGRKVVKQ